MFLIFHIINSKEQKEYL